DDVGTLLDRTSHGFSLGLPAAHDELVAQLALAGLQALGDLAPRRARMAAARGLALAAAHRMVHRVHRHPAHAAEPAEPATPSRLAVRDVLVIEVSDLADHRPTLNVETAHFSRRQAELRVFAFLRHQLAERSGAARHPRRAAGEQLDVVDVGAERNVPERETVPELDLGVRAGLNHLAHLEAVGRQDVTALAVQIVE